MMRNNEHHVVLPKLLDGFPECPNVLGIIFISDYHAP